MKQFLFIILIALSTMAIILSKSEETTPTMPTKRSEMASTIWAGKIYVAGGINLTGSNKSFEAYDIAAGNWEKLPSLPKKLNHVGVAAYNNVIYVSGGFYNARQTKFSDLLYAYSINNKQWKIISKMPDERGAHVMIQRDEYLHLIGGRNYESVWSFNLKNQKWKTDIIAPLPEKRDHINVLQDDKKLYVVGGRQSGEVKKACWEYNFDAQEWSVFAKLPSPRGGQSACLLNHQIHIAGGEDINKGITFERHDIFNLKTKKWSQGAPLEVARHGFISEIFENKWYIFGGGKKAGIKTLYSTTANLEILNLAQ